MRKSKVGLTILLIVIMLLAIVPMTAFAAGGEATANGVEYATLAEALAQGGEVKLLKNVDVKSIIGINKSTTLDLGDYTITNHVEKERCFHVKADSFTINAGKGGMVIPSSNTHSYGFIRCDAVKNFTMSGGQYSGKTENGCFFRLTGGCSGAKVVLNQVNASSNNELFQTSPSTLDKIDATVIGGTYKTETRAFYFDIIDTKTSPIVFNGVNITADRGPCIELAGGKSTFENCNFTVTGNFSGGYSWARAAIGLGYEANATVKSGTYTAKSSAMGASEGYGAYIYTSGGTLLVEGGTFAGSTAALKTSVDKSTYEKATSTITVQGGQFDGDLLTTDSGRESITIHGGNFTGLTDETTKDTNELHIAGGSFNRSVREFVEDSLDYELNNTGTYSYHKTIADALENAQSGAVIQPTQLQPGGATFYRATLKYNDDIGTSVQIEADTDGKLVLPKISRDGYTFLGWADENDQTIAAGETVTLTKNQTFTATWKALEKPPMMEDLPQTGDNSMSVALLVLIAVIAVGGIVVLVRKKR